MELKGTLVEEVTSVHHIALHTFALSSSQSAGHTMEECDAHIQVHSPRCSTKTLSQDSTEASSPKLNTPHTTPVVHMLQLQLLILLALCMEVDPAHTACTLIEADVIEALKARSSNRLHAVIWD